MPATKYIFVTGGVASSLGKGIVASSLAMLLQARGFKVTIQKLDPYLNIDPGTLNPYEHGECFVTSDGAETDLDLGHYERFTGIPTTHANSVTTGKIYQEVINKERRGDYLGKTVQIIPHITDEIKRRIQLLGKQNRFDMVITEIGGTVGDIESLPYIEAVRQLRYQLGPGNSVVIHLTLVPYLAASGELKTKPTQHSVKTLLENGVQPDVLVLRTEHNLSKELRAKVALFCNVKAENVVQSIDARSIYEVPINLLAEKLDIAVMKTLRLKWSGQPELSAWHAFLDKYHHPEKEISIALVGKYVELPDAYKSIVEALSHAGVHSGCKVNLVSIHSEHLTSENVDEKLSGFNGILVAPGFGIRGTEGKITAVQYAREHNIPFLGICLGMQMAVIEFARNVLGFTQANSSEMKKNPHPVIDLMEDQKRTTNKGGTMRLGSYPCILKEGSKAALAYGAAKVSERHRHRYEFNNEYLSVFEASGMVATGINPVSDLVEIVEIPALKWFVGVQFHPEYSSTVLKPHPLFVAFVKAVLPN